MDEVDAEFHSLTKELDKSGCTKRQIAAGTYVAGVWVTAVNGCSYSGDQCHRLSLPSGAGYDLCHASHAEATLAANIKARGESSDGIAWVFNHYWVCETCASALKAIGVQEIRVREAIGKGQG